MLTDAEIAGFMDWRGPGAYTAHKMRKVKAAIAEAVAREREECANVCDDVFVELGKYDGSAAGICGDRIRERSNA